MKKHLHNSLRALFLSLAVLLSLPMLAEQVEIGGINYELVAKQATVIAKSSGKYSGDVVIPESVEHEGAAYSVTSIGDGAFNNCSGLTSVTIPNSVTSIGSRVFRACSGLTSVTIGNSVTSIGEWAFYNCDGLTSVTIPNSVTSIGDNAFGSCSGLTSVTIPNSVTSIGGYAFNYCSGLTSVTIGNGVTSIGQYAFSDCSGLTSIVVEEGNPVYDSRNNCNAIVETASNSLICGCNTSIISNSVTSIGSHAFYGCSALTSVTIPNSVESIGHEAFYYCDGLTSVTIPNSVKSIGEYAFYVCSGLTSVTIGNGVESIGEEAFGSCSGLTSVTIGNSVTSIGDGAFSNCIGLTSVTIPNSVTSIGWVAFYGCSGLTSVTIGNSVTSIGEEAFSDCSKLLDVYCYAENVPSTESDAFYYSPIVNATLHVPAASINSYKSTAPWSGFGNILGLSKEYSLKVSHVGYATLFLNFNAEIPANVKAYVAARVEGNRLKMERVEGVLPANTGVIVLANEGTYTFAESEATPATIGDNLLEGTVVTTQISADPSYSYYVLSNVEGVVAMYLAKLTDGKFQNNAYKAYMKVNKGDLGVFDEEVDSSVEQLSRKFVFDFGDETGIDETEIGNVKSENSALYDLSGRRVQKAQKGIFIQNGKVVVK